MLRPRSFPSPTKCLRCTSLMLGLGRQGLGCDGETPCPTCAPTSQAPAQPLGGGNKSTLLPTHPGGLSAQQAEFPLLFLFVSSLMGRW